MQAETDNRKVVLELDPWSERYMCLRDKGVFSFYHDVDEESYADFCDDIMFLFHVKSFAGQAWIILNSAGGDVYHGLGIYDIVRSFVAGGKKINILGIGLVASMASVIMQAGSKRLVLPHTRILLHQIASGSVSEFEEISQSEERVAETVRLNKTVLEVIAKRSGKNLNEVLKLVKKRDYWLSAPEAKSFGKYGLIDGVVEKWPF